MIIEKFTSLQKLNDNIWKVQNQDSDFYVTFLDRTFPNWNRFSIKKVKDNLLYYDGENLKFSFRINLETGIFKHIDVYLRNDIRPYRRIFLTNGFIRKIRYYEFNSWVKNYDIVVGNKLKAIYTIEYFNSEERYIDDYYKPGSLFYDKEDFLTHMFSEKYNRGEIG
ncbi:MULTISPECIES: hypothetical protein [Weissella]|uniref:Uncharacterized protein n=2 Tax=Weissella TaxID=46255 RepID=A0A1L6RAP0_9LACO|nr:MULTISPECIES: hypothetical protein [Weissella]APS41583.1 hypothetical protein FOL01_0724 [Weissella jogaejeotgali]NKY91258.1 hypothetical protein [Weissella thailandensis]RDS59240.1 hypothetical protein DWV05_06750 [Weissella thailandensis]GEP74754.1 hypothetical protein WTH01_10010 [Weissella thailandensis]